MFDRLPPSVTRRADRAHVWFNVLLGYIIATTLPTLPTWFTDSQYAVCRSFPHSQAVWSWSLFVAITVYTVGSFRGFDRPHRGLIIIVGSVLCFLWYFAMALCMARERFVDPDHSGTLNGLLFFFLAILYGHRAVLYANLFTGARWGTDPFQMYPITFLMLISISQVVIGVSPSSVQAQYDHGAVISVAGANLVGGLVTMTGLHLRRVETGLWLELCGYASLTLTLVVYISTVARTVQVPIATIGYSLSQAFLFACFHRAFQIALYKMALYRGQKERANKYRQVLDYGRPGQDADDPDG